MLEDKCYLVFLKKKKKKINVFRNDQIDPSILL